jgi:uncharacterized protein (DUF169 family)
LIYNAWPFWAPLDLGQWLKAKCTEYIKENTMEKYQKLNDLLNKYYRPQTSPVAVKLFKDEPDSFPEGTVFPSSFLGHPISVCQGMGAARRYGWKIGFRFEDNACPFFVAYFGLRELPDIFTEGGTAYPYFTETTELGALAEASIIKLPVGTMQTLFMEPLDGDLSFEPDVVVVYGNVAQTSRLIAAANFQKGSGIEGGPFSARGACASSMAAPFVTKQCRITLPGGGERVAGHVGDDEIAFSIPRDLVDSVIYGFEETAKTGIAKYPAMYKGLQMQPTFPEKYNELAKQFGMQTKARKE